MFSVEGKNHHFLHQCYNLWYQIPFQKFFVCITMFSSSLLIAVDIVVPYLPFNFVPTLGTSSNFISLTQKTKIASHFSCSSPSKDFVVLSSSRQEISKGDPGVFYIMRDFFSNISEAFINIRIAQVVSYRVSFNSFNQSSQKITEFKSISS